MTKKKTIDSPTFLLIVCSALRKRSPHAVKAVKEFAQKAMGTSDVRIDPSLNKALWARGVKHTDHRIRVRIARKRNDDEDAKEKLYSYVTYVPVASFKGKSCLNEYKQNANTHMLSIVGLETALVDDE
jgi:large subunit ribosomal protein L31e